VRERSTATAPRARGGHAVRSRRCATRPRARADRGARAGNGVWYDLDARGIAAASTAATSCGAPARRRRGRRPRGARRAGPALARPACRVASLSELEQLGCGGSRPRSCWSGRGRRLRSVGSSRFPDSGRRDRGPAAASSAGRPAEGDGAAQSQAGGRGGIAGSACGCRRAASRSSPGPRLAAEVQAALSAGGVRHLGSRRRPPGPDAGSRRGPWDRVPPAAGPGTAVLEPSRLVFGLALGNDGVGILEVLASTGQRFGWNRPQPGPPRRTSSGPGCRRDEQRRTGARGRGSAFRRRPSSVRSRRSSSGRGASA